jgi:hypothetical protein
MTTGYSSRGPAQRPTREAERELASGEHDEVGRYRDRVGEDVPDRRGVLDVLAQLLELLRGRVRRPDPALRPDGGEAGARPRETDEAVEVDVALDRVAELADVDAASGRVVDEPNRVAERERLGPIWLGKHRVFERSLGAGNPKLAICTFDRDSDIYGIRAVESCRARHNSS